MSWFWLIVFGLCCFIIGHLLGARNEREWGAAAAQEAMDKEIAEFNEEVRAWNAVEDALLMIDHEPASKRIKHYSHLELVK